MTIKSLAFLTPASAPRRALLAVSLGLAATAATACTDDDLPPGGADEPDPIAGLVDDCDRTLGRGLFLLGRPTNRQAGDADSYHDPVPDSKGRFGFYPLALAALDRPGHSQHTSSTAGSASNDARCRAVEELLLSELLSDSLGEPLDPAHYPGGEGEVFVGIGLRFENVAFPQTLADAPAFDPSTRAERVIVAEQTISPTAATLHLEYINPDTRVVVDEQRVPLALACATPSYPLTVAWQRDTRNGPFCADNSAGDHYCLVYQVRHGGGDCRFAAEGATLRTITGASIAADLAGAMTPIRPDGALTGMKLSIDTIQLR